MDGVYVRDVESGRLVFEALGAPSRAQVLEVASRSAERIDRLLRKNGRSLAREGDEPVPELLFDEPGLAACYAAAAQGIGVSGERAGQPVLRLVFGEPASDRAALTEPGTDEPVAQHWGINVHAKECVDGRDGRRLERLCRYITRPPVAQQRLDRLGRRSARTRLQNGTRSGAMQNRIRALNLATVQQGDEALRRSNLVQTRIGASRDLPLTDA